NVVATGQRGSADLSAYFMRRVASLLRERSAMGMIATNTIAQGDTREVGLETLLAGGYGCPRAVASQKWPGDANLEVAIVWIWRGAWAGEHYLEGSAVNGITPYLTVPGATAGKPYRLAANAGKSFQGSIVLGMGFVLEPEEAAALIARDARNRDVLFPYLNGEDLNSRWDQSPSRWVINFHDWPLDRESAPEGYAGPVAADFPECLRIVEEKVRPERQRRDSSGEFVLRRPLPDRYWHFGEKRPALYAAISGMRRVLAVTRHQELWQVSLYPTQVVFSDALVVIAVELDGFGLLQSSVGEEWVRALASTLETRLRFTPSDCFETFPFPAELASLESIADRYDAHRCAIMAGRREGLTATCNRMHSSDDSTADIAQLRALHVELDRAVADAYGWTDLDLGHDFHRTKQGIRFTMSERARLEVLARLLQLNRDRHAEEVAQGLHDKTTKPAAKKPRAKSKPALAPPPAAPDLFT
ncbi:MAG: restriction endonuclease, partial [Candidatus Eisenbacteria bacterium]|nr:restriction endonuclease [Candidatus Eisenbacteria bacterium]